MTGAQGETGLSGLTGSTGLSGATGVLDSHVPAVMSLLINSLQDQMPVQLRH